jgi:N-methylhydantoinase A
MQNSCVLGINVGESFAEYSLLDGSTSAAKPLAQKRVFLARESIKQTLLSFLNENAATKPEAAFVSLKIPKRLLDYNLSGAVAHITTEGFEHWLGLAGSRKEVTQKDLIFSVRERVLADGTLEVPITPADIEAIAAKLVMMDCKRVCLHFLHAQTNPANMNAAAEILKSQGLEVFLPSENETNTEVERWNKNALNATISSIFNDRKKEILESLKETLSEEKTYFLNAQGQARPSGEALPLDGYFSSLTALGKVYGEPNKADVLHLGLEGFSLISSQGEHTRWDSDWGPVAVTHMPVHALGIQPTLGIHLNVFDHFDFTTTQEGWEPGPMFLGRGQKLSLLDIWAEHAKLTSLPGLQDRFSAQGIQRFKNSLLALAKGSRVRNTDMGQLTKEMQSLTLQRLALEAFLHRKSEKMRVTGPLASVFANAFKKDANTTVENHDFCESVATAIWGAKSLQGSL